MSWGSLHWADDPYCVPYDSYNDYIEEDEPNYLQLWADYEFEEDADDEFDTSILCNVCYIDIHLFNN
jgi:hypothetical protein